MIELTDEMVERATIAQFYEPAEDQYGRDEQLYRLWHSYADQDYEKECMRKSLMATGVFK